MIDKHRIAALAFGVLASARRSPSRRPPWPTTPHPDPLPVPGSGSAATPGPTVPGMGHWGRRGSTYWRRATLRRQTFPAATWRAARGGSGPRHRAGPERGAVGSRRRAGDAAEPQRVQQRLRCRGINLAPAAPGKGQQFGVAPGDENADVNKRKWLGRYIDKYRAGDLKGGLLGQMPQEQLVNHCRVPRRRRAPSSPPDRCSSCRTRHRLPGSAATRLTRIR